MSVVATTYLARKCAAAATSHVFSAVTIPAGKLAIIRGAFQSDTITASVADSAGNTWAVAIDKDSSPIGGNTSCFIAYCVLTSPLSSGTVTVTLSASTGLAADLAYFDSDTGWLAQASVLDKTSGGVVNVATAWSSGATATTTQADELLVGCAAHANFNGSSSTPAAGWTEEADANCSSAGFTWLVSQWQHVTAAGAYAAQGTWAGSEFGPSAIATFKTAAPSGPFTPASLPGLTVWLDASQLALADGAAVSPWPNLGAGADAPILDAPAPVVKAPGSLYGLPVVRFTHAEGRVALTGSGVTTEWTVIYVARQWSFYAGFAANGRVLTSLYPPFNLLLGWWGGFQDVMYDNGFGSPDTRVPVTLDWKLYSADGTTGLSRLLSDGTILGSVTTPQGWGGTFGLNGYTTGPSGESTDCEVAEVILYDHKLTDLERQSVEAYLRTKWMTPPSPGFPRQVKVVL